ncbi:wd-repeat protein, partial [Daphnia magna]
MIAADCLSNRFSAFCLHLWHRVTYFTIQHQLVATAALLSIIQKGLRSVLEMMVRNNP